MKKILVLCAILFSVIGAQAQKEKKVFYYEKDSILYVQNQPFTGSLYTFCRLQENCPTNVAPSAMEKKEFLVLPNLGVKNEDIDAANQTYAIFIQETESRYWKKAIVVKQEEIGGAIKSIILHKDKKMLVVNTKTFPL